MVHDRLAEPRAPKERAVPLIPKRQKFAAFNPWPASGGGGRTSLSRSDPDQSGEYNSERNTRLIIINDLQDDSRVSGGDVEFISA